MKNRSSRPRPAFLFVPALLVSAGLASTILAQPAPHSDGVAPNGPTPTPSYTPTAEPTSSPTPEPTPTATPEPTPSPTPLPTATPTPAPVILPTRSATLLGDSAVRVDADLLEEATRDFLTASFAVSATGEVAVSLTLSSGSRRVDAVVLRQIQKWRFAPALRSGIAVAAVVKLRVELR